MAGLTTRINTRAQWLGQKLHQFRHAVPQWLGQKLHQFRHAVNDVVKLNAPRQELAATLGWQRTLHWGSPDWYRAYPVDAAPKLEQALKEQFELNPETARTAATSLSYLLHAANDPCHHHTPQEAAQHEAKKDEARVLLGAITEALTEHTGFAYQDTSLLRRGTLYLDGSIKVPGQVDPVDAKALALLKYLATEHKATKGLLSRWHMETARAVAAPKEKGLLNNPALNMTAAAIMAVGGVYSLYNTGRDAIRPLQSNETPLSRAADIASTAAIVLGAFPYGKAVSLLEKGKRTTPKLRQDSNTLMSVHGVSEVVVTGGNIVHGVTTRGAAAPIIGVREITDSVADLCATPIAVGITNTAQDVLWNMVERHTTPPARNTPNPRENHRHTINGVGAVLGTSALSTVNLALATPLLVGYGAIYAATMARKLPRLVGQRINHAVNALRSRPINPPRIGQRVAATALSVLAVFNWTAPPVQAPGASTPSTAPTTETLTPSQAATLLSFYTSPDGETLQELQKRGGSAAIENRYQPSNPTQYIKDAKILTGLPAENIEQAKDNIGAYTDLTYQRVSENTGVKTKGYFNNQYTNNGQNTLHMIKNTVWDLGNIATKGQQSSQPAPQDQQRNQGMAALLPQAMQTRT